MVKKEIKNLSESEKEKMLKDLKIEILKQPTKRKTIKREIARILSSKTKLKGESKDSSKEKK